jgi:hypothetical protein
MNWYSIKPVREQKGKNFMLRHFAPRRFIVILGTCIVLLVTMIPLAAFAQSATAAAHGKGFSRFGQAKIVSPGNNSAHAVQLTSNTALKVQYGGINFDTPGKLTFGAIQTLSTDYNFTHNSCGGGSPRFQINVLGKSAFVYIGPPPNYTGCAMNTWVNAGNLATPTSFVDTSQLPGGTFYDTFASADAKYGSDMVTDIQLVADGGWFFTDGQQVVLVDNVVINSRTYGFE